MQPFEVYYDDLVRVAAFLVDHHPVFPSFAYRFDTADGSEVFSGDTDPNTNGNLQRLANGADIWSMRSSTGLGSIKSSGHLSQEARWMR